MSDLQTLPAPQNTNTNEAPHAIQPEAVQIAEAHDTVGSQEAFQAFMDTGEVASDKNAQEYEAPRSEEAKQLPADESSMFTDMLNKLESNKADANETANEALGLHLSQEDAKDSSEQPRIYNNGDVAKTAGEVVAHQTIDR